MSSVRRYYNDIYYITDSTGAIMALNKLYDALEFEPLYGFDEVVQQLRVMPDGGDYADDDARIAKEKMGLLPLYIMGPSIERSDLTIPAIDAWYSDVVNHIRMLTNETHDEVCLEFEGGTLEHQRCAISDVCPWRYMETYFGDPAIVPEVNDPFFDGNMKRRHELAMARLAVGQHTKILTEDYALTKAVEYRSRYQLIGSDVEKYNRGA